MNDDGTVLQTGIRWRSRAQDYYARGLLLEAVVLRTYLPDDPDHPLRHPVKAALGPPINGVFPTTEATAAGDNSIICVICDVLFVNSTYRGVAKNVPVAQLGGHGRSDGSLWIPRGTRNARNGSTPVGVNRLGDAAQNPVTPPEQLDGDRVLVGFLGDSLNRPIILGGLDHAFAELTFPAYVAPSDTRGDVNERVIRHRGSVIKLDTNGNVDVDAREASPGVYDATGKERTHAAVGSTGGTVRVRTAGGADVTIAADGSVTVQAGAGKNVEVTGTSVNLNGSTKLVARKTDPTKAEFGVAPMGPNGTWDTFLSYLAAKMDILVPPVPPDIGAAGRYAAAKAAGIDGTVTDGCANVKTG